MIEVTQDGENKFTIHWDENDPQESIFNSFTEKDFIDVLQYYCEKELSKLEYTESVSKESGEANYDDKEECCWEEEYSYYSKENNEAS